MAEMEHRCDVCGEVLPDGAYFCGECGSRIPFVAPTPYRVSTPELVPTPDRASTEDIASTPARARTPDSAPTPAAPGDGISADEHSPATDAHARPEVRDSSAQESPTAPAVTYMLVFSTGERAQILGYGRIGRRPTPPPDSVPDHLIVVSDETRTVSKNHLDVWATSAGLEIADLGSANGTVVSMPGIAAERVMPGQRVVVMRGTRISLGDQSFLVE